MNKTEDYDKINVFFFTLDRVVLFIFYKEWPNSVVLIFDAKI